MATLLEDKNRDFRRVKHSAEEKIQLANKGLQHVLSSNISAIGIDGSALIVRFHNGSLYRFPNLARLYEPMLNSGSKGKYFYRKIRRPNKPFSKTGSLPLKSDIELTDIEMFDRVDANVNVERLLGDTEETKERMFKTQTSGESDLLKSLFVGLVTVQVLDLFTPDK